MAADQLSDDRRRQSTTFSLRTLFLILASAGVASVAFRGAADSSFEQRTAYAIVFVGAFLTLWFVARRQFKRMPYAGMLLALGLLFYLLLPISQSRGPTPRMRRSWNLKQIGLALLSYHKDYGSFPPAFVSDGEGKPLYSWRVLILPYLEEQNLAKSIRYEEAWNGPNNAKITQLHLSVFSCLDVVHSKELPSAATGYLAVVGPHAAWTGAKPRKLSEFKDPSKTILAVEDADSGVTWAEPRDLYVGQMSPGINATAGQGISSDHDGGAWVVFADDHVEFLPNTIDPKKLAGMLDIDGQSNTATDGTSR